MLAIQDESGVTYVRADRIDGFKVNYYTLEVTICLNGQTIMTLLESRDEVDKIIRVITENINEEGEEVC